MKRPLYYTGIFILFGLIFIIAWQILALTTGLVSTISVFAEEFASINPLLGYIVATVFGILIGHWFIPPGGNDG